MAKFGIKLDTDNHPLPTSIQRLYTNWKNSSRTPFRILGKYLPQIMPICTDDEDTNYTVSDFNLFIDN